MAGRKYKGKAMPFLSQRVYVSEKRAIALQCFGQLKKRSLSYNSLVLFSPTCKTTVDLSPRLIA